MPGEGAQRPPLGQDEPVFVVVVVLQAKTHPETGYPFTARDMRCGAEEGVDLVADQADVTALGQGFDFVGRLGRQEADAFPGNQLDEQVGAAFRRRGDQGGADEVDRAGGQLGGFRGPGVPAST